jgi:hypothetical protein
MGEESLGAAFSDWHNEQEQRINLRLTPEALSDPNPDAMLHASNRIA